MMNEGKGMADSSRERNGEEDDMFGHRKRKPPPLIEPSADDVPIDEENGSSEDDDVEDDASDSSDDDGFNHEEMKIETAAGKIITLKVQDSDTIGSMKLKIQDEEGIPFDQQELLLGNMLFHNNSAMIANLSIKKGSTLTLVHRLKGSMTIFIKPFLGRTTYPFKVEPFYTPEYLRRTIFAAGLLHDKLIFNGTVLEGKRTLADFHIVDGSTLTLVDKSEEMMNIFVITLLGKTISLLVSPSDTIAKVKSKIEHEERIPADEHALIFNKTVLGDQGSLRDFHIKKNSTLMLMRKSRGFKKIFVKTLTGETITLEVKPSDTIAIIKAKINCQTNIPCDEQALVFNDMILHDVDTLDGLHINKESTLTLMRLSTGFMRILVITPSGTTIDLDVKPSDTIYEVKSKIQEKEGTPRCQQRLLFNSTDLEDSVSVADYKVTKNSTVYVDLRF